MQNNIHPAQAAILNDLRKSQGLKYGQLALSSPLEADLFKFHLKRLQKKKLVCKNDLGVYELTVFGKEIANKIDTESNKIKQTAKLSMLFVIRSSENPDDILLQQRLRHPFYEYWGLLSGPVPWGVQIQKAAEDEIYKQTGYSSQPTVVGILREVNKLDKSGLIIEDKIFTVLEATVSPHEATQQWSGGKNQWININNLGEVDPVFENTKNILESPTNSNFWFRESMVIYDTENY